MAEIPSHIVERASQAFNISMQQLHSAISDWSPLQQAPNLSAFSKPSECGIDQFKMKIIFQNRSPIQVINYLFQNLSAINAELNSDMLRENRVVRQFQNCKVVYDIADIPCPGVKSRDNLFTMMKLDLGEGNWALIQTKVQDSEYPPRQEFVRVDPKYNLHLAEPVPGTPHCQLQIIGLIDPCGDIPKFLVNIGISTRLKIYKEVLKRLS